MGEEILSSHSMDPVIMTIWPQAFAFPHATYPISADRGVLYTYEVLGYGWVERKEHGTELEAVGGFHVHWTPGTSEPDQDNAIVTIRMMEEEHWVGYAVFHVQGSADVPGSMRMETVEAYFFPKQNGEYQRVSESYVQSCVQAAQARARR